MKILHIFRSKPTEDILNLAAILSKGNEAVTFSLYEGPGDYGKLVALIFENDKTVSWW